MSYVASWVDPFLKGVLERRVCGEVSEQSTPEVDVLETSKGWAILANMPGVDPKGVEVSLEEGVLTVSGQSGEEKESGAVVVHSERGFGRYRRSLRLDPARIDAGSVTAVIKNGVLRVEVPKAAPAQSHRIVVKAE